MRFVTVLLAIGLLAATAFSAQELGGQVKGYEYYIFDGASTDSAGNALGGADTLGDTLTTTGTLWYHLGPCPTEPEDFLLTKDTIKIYGDSASLVGGDTMRVVTKTRHSGLIMIVEDGAASVGCSLFVTASPKGSRFTDANWLKYVAGNGSIITDSCNATGNGAGKVHFYNMPDLTQYRGFNMMLKLCHPYTTGAVKGAIKRIAHIRKQK